MRLLADVTETMMKHGRKSGFAQSAHLFIKFNFRMLRGGSVMQYGTI